MGARGVAIGATVLVLVAGGAVVADRVAVGMAQDVAVRELRAIVEGVTGEPEVRIGGFPFLTQLLAGKLTDLTARADGLAFDGVEVTDVQLDAEGVTTNEPYTVDQAALTGTLSVEALQQLLATQADLDLDLRLAGDQLVAATHLLGLDVAATLVPRAENGGIRFDVATVTLGDLAVDVTDLPGGLAAQLSDLAVPVDGLPEGIALTGIAVRDGGVRITATGTDVVLPEATTGPTP